MVEEAEKYKQRDQEFKEKAIAKNDLENYIFSVKNKLNSNIDMGENKLRIMTALLSECLKWLEIPRTKDEYIEMKNKVSNGCDPILVTLHN
jgi:molecular chaperone DnaK (HSP70)